MLSSLQQTFYSLSCCREEEDSEDLQCYIFAASTDFAIIYSVCMLVICSRQVAHFLTKYFCPKICGVLTHLIVFVLLVALIDSSDNLPILRSIMVKVKGVPHSKGSMLHCLGKGVGHKYANLLMVPFALLIV